MNTSIAYQYYLKAMDYYPYNMEQVMENLNYALSYQEDHCQANCLMGRTYMEVLKEYKEAEFYFEKALCSNLEYPDTYKLYSLLMIWKGEFDKAERLIAYGMKVKGMNRSALYINSAIMWECRGDFIKARKSLESALQFTFDSCSADLLDREIRRVNRKINRKK